MSLSKNIYGIPESDPDLYASRDIVTIAKRWDLKAMQWDADLNNESCHLNHEDAYRHFIRLGKQLVMERMALCATGSAVDLGCGTGVVLAELSMYFKSSVGVDVSPEMLKVAASKRIANAEWQLGDVFEGSWSSRKHVAVLSRGIILSHYGQELARQVIAQAIHALAPGGFGLFDFLAEEASEATRILAPNKTYFSSDWLIDQARCLGSHSTVVAGSPDDRVRFLILRA